jgi:hypothetical protein
MTRREAAVDLHLVARGALQSAHEQSRAVARSLEEEAEGEGEEKEKEEEEGGEAEQMEHSSAEADSLSRRVRN